MHCSLHAQHEKYKFRYTYISIYMYVQYIPYINKQYYVDN